MEKEAMKPTERLKSENNNKWGGILLIAIGAIFLLQRLPATAGLIPYWVFTWPVLLMAIGIFIGLKSGFKNYSWLVLLLIGGYFVLHNNNFINGSLRPYALPIGLIALGFIVAFNKKKNCYKYSKNPAGETTITDISEDTITLNSTFGSVEKSVYTKNFQGGTVSCIFAGGQINFARADFEGVAILDVSVIFGGLDIVIPANWNLKNEVNVMFGGIEDKRKFAPSVTENGKTLILKGNVMFGGIEIKSY